MKIIYKVHAKTVRDEKGKSHTVFGIDAVSEDGIVQASIADAFDSYEEAEKLARKCNELELSPMHLQDIIEDALVP